MVEWKKLGEICDFVRGPFGGALKKEIFAEKGYAIYEQQHAIYGTWDFRYFIDEIKYNKMRRFEVLAGDILMSCSGTMGKTSIVPANHKKGIINQALLKLSVKDGIFNRYVKNYMDSQLFQIKLMKKTAGGAIQNVASVSILKDLSIPIPSLSEQNRIVGILDTFMDSIENLKQQIAKRRKQYEHYRDQLLDLEGKDGVEKLSFGLDFQLKARIGWQGLTKKEYRSSGSYKLVTGTDFTKSNRIDFDNCVYVDKERYDQDINIQLKEGDVLITKDGTLGKIAIIDKLETPSTLNGGVFVVRDLQKRIVPKYMMYYLTSHFFVNWMKSNHTQGSIQHLTQKLLEKFTIFIPSLAEQNRIVSFLDTFEASISNLEAQLAQRQKQYEYYRNKLLTFE